MWPAWRMVCGAEGSRWDEGSSGQGAEGAGCQGSGQVRLAMEFRAGGACYWVQGRWR